VAGPAEVPAIVAALNSHLERAVNETPVWEGRFGPDRKQVACDEGLGSHTETPVDAHVVVSACIGMLARINTQASLAALEPLMRHEDDWVRGVVVRQLLFTGPKDKPALIGRVLGEPALQQFASWVILRKETHARPELRQAAVKLLASPPTLLLERDVHKFLRRIPVEERLAFCKKTLSAKPVADGNLSEIWQASLRALGDEKSESTIPDLVKGMAHPDQDVREDAAQQLGRTYSPKAVPALLQALKDDEDGVRKNAKAALVKIREYLSELQNWRDLEKPGR
jgi:HEAT repeat protein